MAEQDETIRTKTDYWFIALALAVLALLGQTSVVAALSPYSFWLALVAAALLLLATMVKDL